MTRLPALGPRGEGWVVIQGVLLVVTAAAGWLGPAWDGAPRLLSSIAGVVLIAAGLWLAAHRADLVRFLTALLRKGIRRANARRSAAGKMRGPNPSDPWGDGGRGSARSPAPRRRAGRYAPSLAKAPERSAGSRRTRGTPWPLGRRVSSGYVMLWYVSRVFPPIRSSASSIVDSRGSPAGRAMIPSSTTVPPVSSSRSASEPSGAVVSVSTSRNSPPRRSRRQKNREWMCRDLRAALESWKV